MSDQSAQDDDQLNKQQTVQPAVAAKPAKEQEISPPAGGSEGDELMAQIRTRSEAIDKEQMGEVLKAVSEAKLAQPRPEIPPSVEDVGVVHPQAEADKVIAGGATLELPITEASFKKGLHHKVAGVVVNKVVLGVASLSALVMWVARIIKMAHKHAMKVVFRRAD